MPFSIASAPAIFQRLMEQLLAGINRVVWFLDDILITGGNHQEHLSRLEGVLSELGSSCLTVLLQKCDFF